MTDAIRTESLTKYYGPVVGVERLDLRVAPGEVYGFLGPNGAGKTTTIRLLLDLLRPTRGRALINGRDCAHRQPRGPRAGRLPPGGDAALPEMSGRAFLDFLAALQPAPVDPTGGAAALRAVRRRRRRPAPAARRPVARHEAQVRHHPGADGAARRVLILDEPTSGLDPLMIEAFAETIAELKREGATTMFLSSHVLSEVERLCDRIGIIRRGALARETSLAELRRDDAAAHPCDASPARRHHLPAGTSRALLSASAPRTGTSNGAVRSAISSPRSTRATIADIEIEPFKLEDYVLGVYSEGRMMLARLTCAARSRATRGSSPAWRPCSRASRCCS